jgi:hypothetical protein
MKSQILNKKKNIRKWLKNKPVGQAFQPAIKYGTLKPLKREELSFVE